MTSLFCSMILPSRTRTTKHEDGAKLLERPDLGFDGVGDHPPLIFVAKSDGDLHCLEFLVATSSWRGLTVCLCEHGL